VEVKIGITDSPRELVFNSAQTPSEVEKLFTDALDKESGVLALTDEKRAKEVLAKQAGITDPKILDISYNDFKLLSPQNIEPTDAAAKNILAQFLDASQKVEDYVDGSILDGLRKDGVFTALAQKYKR